MLYQVFKQASATFGWICLAFITHLYIINVFKYKELFRLIGGIPKFGYISSYTQDEQRCMEFKIFRLVVCHPVLRT